MNKKTSGWIAGLVLLNLLPALGAYLGYWDWKSVLYLLWAECVLLGLSTLFVYAKHLIVFFALLGAAFGLFSMMDLPFWSDLHVPLTFWSLYSLCWLFYFELVKSRLGLALRQWHPLQYFFVYLSYMGLAMTACVFVTASIYDEWALLGQIPHQILMIFIGVAALIPTFTIGFLRIIDMIGARHFLYFLFGTYHRPAEKERIVLFLDMVGSAGMAEKLKAKDSMALIARFIFDAGAIFRSHGGDILNYTGDGLVVLWPIQAADRALAAAEALRGRMAQSAPSYKKRFGMVPDFRIGLHGGQVVISQIGEEKLFLGLYGDVVNTAARLEALNKDLGTKILFSKAVKQRLSIQTREHKIKPLGLQDIKGREERIEVFTLAE